MRNSISKIKFFFAGTILFLLFFIPWNSTAQTVDNFELNEIIWFGEVVNNWGEISFELVESGTSLMYLNVTDLELPGTDGWLIQNFPLHPEFDNGRYATTFSLNPFSSGIIAVFVTDIGFDQRPIEIDVPIINPPFGVVYYNQNNLNGRNLGTVVLNEVSQPEPNGTQVINLDLGLVKFTYHKDVPDATQGVNECAPTSAANSFEWLDEEYELELPDEADEAAEIKDVLKDDDHMKTDPEDGTSDEDMIKGKLQFIEDHDLPIMVEYQDDELESVTNNGVTINREGSKPTFEWIFEQLKKGQDVELGFTYDAGSGHWVTLTGAIEIFGQKILMYNDPDDGKQQTKFSFLGDTESAEFPGFLELESEASNSIDIAVAESPEEVGLENVSGYPALSSLSVFPNPFSSDLSLEFELNYRSQVSIQLMDFQGRHVSQLLEETMNPGTHSYAWSEAELSGTPIPSGLYSLKIVIDRQVLIHRLIHID